jgi:predicted alpha/beta-fold hydrolase
MAEAARDAWSLGLASLRLNLRGADGEGGDFYHGGLTADLAAAVRDLAGRFERVFALGFSLGGHVTMRYATEVDEPSFTGCAAVCSPLDLAVGVDAIDRPSMAVYRRYVLRNLKAGFSPTALERSPVSPARLQGVEKLREWDSLTVVPRFGFRDTDDYYARASVGPLLSGLRRPALLVAAKHDPMIPPSAIRPHLEGGIESSLIVRWLGRGGHVALPASADLQLDGSSSSSSSSSSGGRSGVVPQILAWLQEAGDERL